MAFESFVKFLLGGALFCAAGYFMARAALGEGKGKLELAAFGLAFALLIPPLLLFALNIVFGLKITEVAVYAAYALSAVGAYLLSLRRTKSPPKSRAV